MYLAVCMGGKHCLSAFSCAPEILRCFKKGLLGQLLYELEEVPHPGCALVPRTLQGRLHGPKMGLVGTGLQGHWLSRAPGVRMLPRFSTTRGHVVHVFCTGLG